MSEAIPLFVSWQKKIRTRVCMKPHEIELLEPLRAAVITRVCQYVQHIEMAAAIVQRT